MIHERCARSLECLPSLQPDPNRPEDVLKVDADEEGIASAGHDAAELVAAELVRAKQKDWRGTRKARGDLDVSWIAGGPDSGGERRHDDLDPLDEDERYE